MKNIMKLFFAVVFLLTPVAFAQAQAAPTTHQVTGTLTLDPGLAAQQQAAQVGPTYELVKKNGKWIYQRTDTPANVNMSRDNAEKLIGEISAIAKAKRQTAALWKKVNGLSGSVDALGNGLNANRLAINSLDNLTVTRLSELEGKLGNVKKEADAAKKNADYAAGSVNWLWLVAIAGFVIAVIALIVAFSAKPKTPRITTIKLDPTKPTTPNPIKPTAPTSGAGTKAPDPGPKTPPAPATAASAPAGPTQI